jgi:hypothetical protein
VSEGGGRHDEVFAGKGDVNMDAAVGDLIVAVNGSGASVVLNQP